jgi:hypothetical protein
MKRISAFPLFLFLLPAFFVLHGCMENYDFVPVKDALLLTGLYCGVSAILAFLFWLFYRDLIKAALLSFCIMAFHFFFGSVHDSLKKYFPGSFLSTYSFILPAALVIFLLVLVLVKRRKKPLTKLSFYLNTLLIILIAVDTILLLTKVIGTSKQEQLTIPDGMVPCKDCPKPDIYFIIADEYVGNTTLKDKFGFDNSAFINDLATRGFHTIPYSSSNYNFTPYSVASTLNMDYLDIRAQKKADQSDLALCYATIKNNRFLRFLQSEGYTFRNYSIFDFQGQPARTEVTFLPVKTKLITGQTFLSRFNRDIRYHLVTNLETKSEIKRMAYGFLHNNKNIYTLTQQEAVITSPAPKLILTHLHLPHYPYYFDKDGKERPLEKLVEGNQTDKAAYVQYLQYGNKKYLELIDHILKASLTPPIIILMGDHGFRHFTEEVDLKYWYLNQLSLYTPGKNYAAYSDSLTNVNFLRVLLNTEYKQQLPLLKDQAVFIEE